MEDDHRDDSVGYKKTFLGLQSHKKQVVSFLKCFFIALSE